MSSNQLFNFNRFFESEDERHYNLNYVFRSSSSSLSSSSSFSFHMNLLNNSIRSRPRTGTFTSSRSIVSQSPRNLLWFDDSRESSSSVSSPSASYEVPPVRFATRATHHRQRCEVPNCVGFAVTPLPSNPSEYHTKCFNCRMGHEVRTRGQKSKGGVKGVKENIVDLVGDDKSKSHLEKPEECPICSEGNVCLRVLLPCKHWMCEDCMVKMVKDECPYCRCRVDKFPSGVAEKRRNKRQRLF